MYKRQGDTMAVRTAPIVYHKPQISTPYTYMAYKAVNKGEDDKVSTALALSLIHI